ncbi:hypothetical protein GCM10025855_16650 [Shewanella glacialipiscicola]|uniref:Uncharacterized protein n=1 Tax=Shewanella glacialipiscicola TaxID=614069 RepID=A0ABQ6J308_9GAMM|nr:hypothetical protein GCM10025855_16650 [Shewanella glacialipiscicola]
MKKYSFVAILIVSLIVMSLIAYFKAESGFFVGNIIPEMIGVCVELLVIIFVLDKWQKKKRRIKALK